MRKKTKIQKRPPKSADSLLKTRNKKVVELTEQELGKISGGSGSQPKQTQGSLWTPLPVI
jgi:hypothetical protein